MTRAPRTAIAAAALALAAAAGLAETGARGVILDLRRPRLAGVTITRVTGGEPLEWAGARLAGGDINGDGIADLVIAAPGGSDDRPSRRGRLYVLFGAFQRQAAIDLKLRKGPPAAPGGPATIVTGADVVIDGPVDFDHLGRSLAVADLDADGFADIVAGAPRSGGRRGVRPGCGQVHILHGAATLPRFIALGGAPAGIRTQTVVGRMAGDALGETLAVADLTGDRIPDLILGAPQARGSVTVLGGLDVGEVWVVVSDRWRTEETIDLADPAQSGRLIRLAGSDPGDQAGSAVAVGDFDGDDATDLAVGARSADGPDNQRPDAGEVYLLRGPLAPGARVALASSAEAIFHLPDIGDLGGGSLAFGDVDGDGFSDMGIGAELADGYRNGRLDTGDVVLVAGRPAPAIRSLRPAPEESALPGRPLSARRAGDAATGAEASGPAGPVFVDLARVGLPGVETFHGADPGDHTGVRSLADLDGDGRAELLLGAEDSSSLRNARAGGGEARVIPGGLARAPVQDLGAGAGLTIAGPVGNVHLGKAVAALDLNGDGAPELIVAAPQAGQALAGAVYIISGDFRKLLHPEQATGR